MHMTWLAGVGRKLHTKLTRDFFHAETIHRVEESFFQPGWAIWTRQPPDL